MPDNFSVDVVETDEFGWTAILKEKRYFTFFKDADAFSNQINEAGEAGERSGTVVRARRPVKLVVDVTTTQSPER